MYTEGVIGHCNNYFCFFMLAIKCPCERESNKRYQGQRSVFSLRTNKNSINHLKLIWDFSSQNQTHIWQSYGGLAQQCFLCEPPERTVMKEFWSILVITLKKKMIWLIQTDGLLSSFCNLIIIFHTELGFTFCPPPLTKQFKSLREGVSSWADCESVPVSSSHRLRLRRLHVFSVKQQQKAHCQPPQGPASQLLF